MTTRRDQTKVVGMRLELDLLARLDDEASRRRISRTALVVKAVEMLLPGESSSRAKSKSSDTPAPVKVMGGAPGNPFIEGRPQDLEDDWRRELGNLRAVPLEDQTPAQRERKQELAARERATA